MKFSIAKNAFFERQRHPSFTDHRDKGQDKGPSVVLIHDNRVISSVSTQFSISTIQAQGHMQLVGRSGRVRLSFDTHTKIWK